MAVAGIDIGSRIAKCVLMNDNQVLSYATMDTGIDSTETARQVMKAALVKAHMSESEIESVVATGYGQVRVRFAGDMISEIACHAKGVNYFFPQARTILDVGGQDSKIISCDGNGRVIKFAMNDKCAGGTGRFLETIAELLQLPLESMGEMAVQAQNPLRLSTHCVIYEKSEVLLQLRRGAAKADILAGIYDALVTRIMDLATRVNLEQDFVFGGGVAKNNGLMIKLKKRLGLEPLVVPEPLIQGAVGAAVLAGEKTPRKGIQLKISG